MKSLDYYIRRIIPSAAALSYNPLFKLAGYVTDFIARLLFPEFRQLPPNHLRVRVGVQNRVFFNQALHLEVGCRFWSRVFTSLPVNLQSDILEIGCGCGRLPLQLLKTGYTGKFTGVDLDDEMLDYCRANFPASHYQFILSEHKSKTYHCGEQDIDLSATQYYRIPLEDDSQDFIYSNSLFSHLLVHDLVNYIEESCRLLRDGGVMQMSFFCIDAMQDNLDGRFSFKHRIDEAYVESMKYPEAAVAYEKQYMRNLCEQAGFSEIDFSLNTGQSLLLCVK